MSRPNANLSNSLMWNLREMTNLIKTIRSISGDVKCTSWRHPLISCGELDVLQMLEDNKDCDRYTYLLELTFDRLIYLLNLMVNYLENFNALVKFKPGKNVERPTNLSMSTVLYMFWDRVQEISKETTVNSKEKRDLTKQSKISISSTTTQSDMSAISSCPTCDLAQSSITEIVLKMEKFFEEDAASAAVSSAVITQRKLMKEKIVESSNWSAMKTWVTAILQDLSAIYEEAHKFKADNRKLKCRIDSRESNLIAKMRKHEEDARIMQKMYRENEERTRLLDREIKMLTEEKQRQSNELASQIGDLKNRNAELVKHLVEMETKKKSLEDKLVRKEKLEAERSSEWRAKLEAEVKKRDEIQSEVVELKEYISKLRHEKEVELKESKKKCRTLEMYAEELTEKLQTLKVENGRLLASLNDKQKELDSSARKLLEAFPDLHLDDKCKYKASGNPVTDMCNQIEANNLRIGQLTLHNENLKETISRIKNLKK